MDKKELVSLICELYGIETVTSMIEAQISKFTKQHGYSYKDIARAVFYYVEVLGKKPRLEMGIGIVPYVLNDAIIYFKKQKAIEEERVKQGKELKKVLKEKVDTILVKPTREKRGIAIIKIDDIE